MLSTTSSILSQIDAWCLRVLHVFSFLHSLAWCFVPVQLKQSFWSLRIFKPSLVLVTELQFADLWLAFLQQLSMIVLLGRLSHVFDVVDTSSQSLLTSFQSIATVVVQLAHTPNCVSCYLFLSDWLWFPEHISLSPSVSSLYQVIEHCLSYRLKFRRLLISLVKRFRWLKVCLRFRHFSSTKSFNRLFR